MSKENLKYGIFQILIANILNMLFSMGTNFFLPKYLSVDTYSQIKTYQLYVSYVVVLHLGYNDGMYLKYGGRTFDEINPSQLQKNLSTLRWLQLFITVCAVIVSVLLRDVALLVASLSILPQNIIGYYKNFYQAVGEFKRYSRVMNFNTGATFLINMVLLFVINTDNYVIYILGYLLLSFCLWILLEIQMTKTKGTKLFSLSFSFSEIYVNIKNGILLLLGNFSSILLTSMDRWFTKILIGNVAFAQYSFAVSMENFLNVAVSPITVTMYNYFCNHDDAKDIKRIRELIIGFSTIIMMAAFPVKFIMERFLQHYMDSVMVIYFLFAAQMFYIIIKSIYVNLYKARKMQKKYFNKLSLIVVVAFVFNVICYSIYNCKESFAVGTLMSAIVWFFLCQLDFREIDYQIRHYIFIFFECIAFLSCGYFLDSIIGFIVYFTLTLIMMKLLLSRVLSQYLNMTKSFINKFRASNKQ